MKFYYQISSRKYSFLAFSADYFSFDCQKKKTFPIYLRFVYLFHSNASAINLNENLLSSLARVLLISLIFLFLRSQSQHEFSFINFLAHSYMSPEVNWPHANKTIWVNEWSIVALTILVQCVCARTKDATTSKSIQKWKRREWKIQMNAKKEKCKTLLRYVLAF